MNDQPTAVEVAAALGITDYEAGTYVVSCSAMAQPGKWLIHFSVETPHDLRKKLKRNGMTDALVCPVLIPAERPTQ